MHAVLRATAWAAVALGFFALGADVYWSWKAQGFAYRPIGFYLDLIDTRWAFDLRVAATRVCRRRIAVVRDHHADPHFLGARRC